MSGRITACESSVRIIRGLPREAVDIAGDELPRLLGVLSEDGRGRIARLSPTPPTLLERLRRWL